MQKPGGEGDVRGQAFGGDGLSQQLSSLSSDQAVMPQGAGFDGLGGQGVAQQIACGHFQDQFLQAPIA